jgi:hypothetical protein
MVVSLLVDVVGANDIRVAEPRHGTSFSRESGQYGALSQAAAWQHLDGQLPID